MSIPCSGFPFATWHSLGFVPPPSNVEPYKVYPSKVWLMKPITDPKYKSPNETWLCVWAGLGWALIDYIRHPACILVSPWTDGQTRPTRARKDKDVLMNAIASSHLRVQLRPSAHISQVCPSFRQIPPTQHLHGLLTIFFFFGIEGSWEHAVNCSGGGPARYQHPPQVTPDGYV